MKKYLILILLILLSCQKDEIVIETPIEKIEMIFDVEQTSVIDGQDISFEVLTSEPHQLIISTQGGSVITKESFQPEVGMNTRKIFTSILPKETLILKLINDAEEVSSVSIIIE